MDNQSIAEVLLREARALAAAGDNLYRVRAYRQAAGALQTLDCPVADLIAAEGMSGLRRLPGVGASLAKTIAQFAARPELARAG